MIEINNLVKKYGDHTAVDHLSLVVEPGKIYGFLGPNGAGKSTTMNMITGYLGATSGEIKINGHDRKEICFDRAHGSYYPSVQWEKEIVVDATDETLLHWTVNALNRNNYGCRISPCEADASLPRLIVEGNDSLSLHTATNEVRFTSFAALIAYLKTPVQKG